MRIIALMLMMVGPDPASLARGPQQTEVPRREGLRSADDATRLAAARAVLEERRALIAELCAIVEETSDGDYESGLIAESAIRLLGRLRAAEAAPALAEVLTFPKPTKGPLAPPPMPFREALPSVAALIEIGMPSVEPVLRKAESSDDLGVIVCAALTLDRILGTDAAVAAIDARMADERDAGALRRLRRLRQRIDEIERKTTDR